MLKSQRILTSVALVGVGLVMGVLLVSNFSGQGMSRAFALNEASIGAKTPPVQVADNANALNEAFASTSEAVLETVVNISARMKGREETRGWSLTPSEASGSGVIISKDGYILTNNHVVENAIYVEVKTSNGKTYEAKVIGRDPDTDVAVLKVEANDLKPAYFGNSTNVRLGEWVLAVGNPLSLSSTVTAGIVSAQGRGDAFGFRSSQYSVNFYIQTDAAINPGNSGGGLFDLKGQLIGINTAIKTNTGYFQGYGFAIPINLAKAVAEDLIEDGKIDRGVIGIQISTVDENYAAAVGLNRVTGVLVQGVLDGSGGEKAGLETGDVILRVDGREVRSSAELQSVVSQRRAGESITLTMWGDNHEYDVNVTLQPREGEAIAIHQSEESEEEIGDGLTDLTELGVVVEPVDNQYAEILGSSEGVRIAEIDENGPSGRSGNIGVNDVIFQANGIDISSPQDLAAVIRDAGDKRAITVRVRNADGERITALPLRKNNG